MKGPAHPAEILLGREIIPINRWLPLVIKKKKIKNKSSIKEFLFKQIFPPPGHFWLGFCCI